MKDYRKIEDEYDGREYVISLKKDDIIFNSLAEHLYNNGYICDEKDKLFDDPLDENVYFNFHKIDELIK